MDPSPPLPILNPSRSSDSPAQHASSLPSPGAFYATGAVGSADASRRGSGASTSMIVASSSESSAGPRYHFADERRTSSSATHAPSAAAYALVVRQQPERARICSFKDKIDRRPVDPPPVVQVIATVPSGDASAVGRANADLLSNGNLFLTVKLVDGLTGVEVRGESGLKCTAGTTIQSPHRLRDLDGEMVVFFAFPDLSIRTEGNNRLEFGLFGINPVTNVSRLLTTAVSDPFAVLPPKRFPGMAPSTLLTRHIAEQGFKLRVRKKNRSVVTHVKRAASEESGGSSSGTGGDAPSRASGASERSGSTKIRRPTKTRREASPGPDQLLGVAGPGPNTLAAPGALADDERSDASHLATPRPKRGTRGARARSDALSSFRSTPVEERQPTLPAPDPVGRVSDSGARIPAETSFAGLGRGRRPRHSSLPSQGAPVIIAGHHFLPAPPTQPYYRDGGLATDIGSMPPPLHPASASIPSSLPAVAAVGASTPGVLLAPPTYGIVPLDAPKTLPIASEGLSALASVPQPRPSDQILPPQRLPVGLVPGPVSGGQWRRRSPPSPDMTSVELSATTSESSSYRPSSAPLSTEPSTAASEPSSSAELDERMAHISHRPSPHPQRHPPAVARRGSAVSSASPLSDSPRLRRRSWQPPERLQWPPEAGPSHATVLPPLARPGEHRIQLPSLPQVFPDDPYFQGRSQHRRPSDERPPG